MWNSSSGIVGYQKPGAQKSPKGLSTTQQQTNTCAKQPGEVGLPTNPFTEQLGEAGLPNNPVRSDYLHTRPPSNIIEQLDEADLPINLHAEQPSKMTMDFLASTSIGGKSRPSTIKSRQHDETDHHQATSEPWEQYRRPLPITTPDTF